VLDTVKSANISDALRALVDTHTKPRRDQAELLYQRAVDISYICHTAEQLKGQYDRSYARSLFQLAYFYLRYGKADRAESPMERCVEIIRAAPGDNTDFLLIALTMLARVYGAVGKLADAESACMEAMGISKANEKTKSLYTETLYTMARIRVEQGRGDEAIPFLTEEIEILGEHHPNSLRLLNILADVYETQGKLVEVEAFLQ